MCVHLGISQAFRLGECHGEFHIINVENARHGTNDRGMSMSGGDMRLNPFPKAQTHFVLARCNVPTNVRWCARDQ